MKTMTVNRLVPAGDAFRSLQGGAAASRIASLQCMTYGMLTAPSGARTATQEWPQPVQADAAELGVPLVRASRPATFWKDSSDHRSSTKSASRRMRPLRDAFDAVDSTLEPKALKTLLERSLVGPTLLERVSSAQILDSLALGQHQDARAVLQDGLSSRFTEIRSIAELSSVGDEQTAPVVALAAPTHRGPASDRTLSITLHGTWGRLASPAWYVPGSPLHEHIRQQASANLYSDPDYPRWSGGYSDAERVSGAQGLLAWVQSHTTHGEVDTIYAHSHGGNVALEAIKNGLKVRMLVLLHVPPIGRSDAEWGMIRANVERTVVYRVRLDRVVFADLIRRFSLGAALSQRFDANHLPHVDSNPNPIHGPWFDHGYYVETANWVKHRVANDVVFYASRPPMR